MTSRNIESGYWAIYMRVNRALVVLLTSGAWVNPNNATDPLLFKSRAKATIYRVVNCDVRAFTGKWKGAPAVIHNGDHAQFEIDHANTPPEQRPHWPLPSFDAMDWAKAFNKRFPAVAVDDALGWFANALMRGYDEARARSAERSWA